MAPDLRPPAGRRHIYVVDQQSGKVLDRFDVSGWNETQIRELENRIRARSAEDGVFIRDTSLDRET